MPYKSLLLMRFAVFNTGAAALLGVAWQLGWVAFVWQHDITYLVSTIAGIFLFGLAWVAFRVGQTGRQLDTVRTGAVPTELSSIGKTSLSRMRLNEILRLKLSNRVAPIKTVANTLVILGLIGTVLGFIIALEGVSAETAADVNAVPAMIGNLIAGMSVALHTTLVGAILNVWLNMNVRLLEGGSVKLYTAIVELRERAYA